jgi:hypothetical protein
MRLAGALTSERAICCSELSFSSSEGSSGQGPGVPVRPAEVRIVPASRIPRRAVAALGAADDGAHPATRQAKAKPEHQVMISLMRHAFPSQ